MRNKNSRLIAIEDRALENGDVSNIDFEGFVDNVPFDGGKADNFELTIGSGQFIPGFEEQLIGMKISETREINVKFPEEYHSKELAGKDSMFRVTLNSIKAKEVPALDDEFVKDVSEFDTLDELKADIKNKMEERNANRSKVELEDELFKTVAKNAEIDVPESMIEHEVEHMVSEYNWRLQMQGMNLDTYLKMLNQDINTFKAQFKETATERVRIQLVLEKISEIEKIEADESAVNEKIAKMAENYGQSVEDFSKNLRDEDKKYIAEEARIQKIADFLTANAKLTEVTESKEGKETKAATKKPRTTKAKTKKEE